MSHLLRIATRQSQLALWQANHVAMFWQQHYPDISVQLVPLLTQGDRVQDKSLADIGGKGLFIKELEFALLNDQADIAVHSMKDVPPELPDSLCVAAMLPREDVRDVLVSTRYKNLAALPQQAVVGTCSVRRQAQLLAMRPDLTIKMLRGNIDTRLRKVESGEFDAIILAAAGLKRLGLQHTIQHYFSVDEMLPSVGQGAVGIECLTTATDLIAKLQALQDPNTALCVQVERDLVRALHGNCHSPIGSYARLDGEQLSLWGLVANADGSIIVRATLQSNLTAARQLGERVAQQLIDEGALELLR